MIKLIIFGIIEILSYIVIGHKDIQTFFIIWTILSFCLLAFKFKDEINFDIGDSSMVGSSTSQSSSYQERIYAKKTAKSISEGNEEIKKIKKGKKLSKEEYLIIIYCILNVFGNFLLK
ncbi:MAG: hypothetical protein FH753_09730 [Firmicutes bacterium]|nr:hypothetical protein [Bacillota bacterium]